MSNNDKEFRDQKWRSFWMGIKKRMSPIAIFFSGVVFGGMPWFNVICFPLYAMLPVRALYAQAGGFKLAIYVLIAIGLEWLNIWIAMDMLASGFASSRTIFLIFPAIFLGSIMERTHETTLKLSSN